MVSLLITTCCLLSLVVSSVSALFPTTLDIQHPCPQKFYASQDALATGTTPEDFEALNFIKTKDLIVPVFDRDAIFWKAEMLAIKLIKLQARLEA